jgi:hypothetical protein
MGNRRAPVGRSPWIRSDAQPFLRTGTGSARSLGANGEAARYEPVNTVELTVADKLLESLLSGRSVACVGRAA